MKKTLLAGALAAALSATSAHAFLFTLSGNMEGMQMTVTGLPPSGTPGFTVAYDLSTGYGNSTVSTGLGGLAPVSSVGVNTIYADGQLAIYNPLLPYNPPNVNPILRSYNMDEVFDGLVVTTLTSLTGMGALPATLDTSTPNFSGAMTITYNGTFGGPGGFPILGIPNGTTGSGVLNINFAFNTLTDVLTLAITETYSGWGGFEAVFDHLDNTIGNNSGTLAAFIWAGKTVTQNGAPPNAANPFDSTGNFRMVPEPATLGLLGLGLLGLAAARRRQSV